MPLGFSAAPLPSCRLPLSLSARRLMHHTRQRPPFICTNRIRVRIHLCVQVCARARVVPATLAIQHRGALPLLSQLRDIECCSKLTDCLP